MTQNDWALINSVMDEAFPIHNIYSIYAYSFPDIFLSEEYYHILSAKAVALYSDDTISFVKYDFDNDNPTFRVLCAYNVTNVTQFLDSVYKFVNEYPDYISTIFYQ